MEISSNNNYVNNFEFSSFSEASDNDDCIKFSDCQDKCQCAIWNANSTFEGCRNNANFFNYLLFNYCTMEGLEPVSLFVMV